MKRRIVMLLLFVCIICSVNAKAYKSLGSIGLGGGFESILSSDYGANTTSVVIGLFAYDQSKAESKTVFYVDGQFEIPMKISTGNYTVKRSDINPDTWMNVGLISGIAYKKNYSNVPLEAIIGAGLAFKEDALVVSTSYGNTGALELSLGLGVSVVTNYYFSDNFSVMFNVSQQYGILNWAWDANDKKFKSEDGVFRLSTAVRVGFGLSLIP